MIDTRISYQGAKVRIRGLEFSKAQNHLFLLTIGINAMKARLASGRDENDGKTKPLTRGYARYKSRVTRRAAIRDLRLTGQLLDGIKPRYGEDHQALADATGRLGRLKARVNRELLKFSPADQEIILSAARAVFREAAEQVFHQLSPKRRNAGAYRQPVGFASFRNR